MNAQFKNALKRFLATLAESSGETITDEMDLIESGVIDSLNLVKLIVFIEEQAGTEIPIETLDLDHIRTVTAIISYYAGGRA